VIDPLGSDRRVVINDVGKVRPSGRRRGTLCPHLNKLDADQSVLVMVDEGRSFLDLLDGVDARREPRLNHWQLEALLQGQGTFVEADPAGGIRPTLSSGRRRRQPSQC
jgi:hypothetical protein